MAEFTLYWLTGKKEIVKGNSIAEAMTQAGYGNESLRALDFYGTGRCNQYEWNGQRWENIEVKKMFCKENKHVSIN